MRKVRQTVGAAFSETTDTLSHSRYIENGDCVISLTMPGERAEIEWRHYVQQLVFEAIKRDRHLQIQGFSAGKRADFRR